MSRPEHADLEALIQQLVDAGVDFIVVGGAAAVLHGAPTTTLDLDIVPNRADGNIAKLTGVLQGLDAVVRGPGVSGIGPDAQLLAGNGQVRISTSLGPLDSLAILHDGRGYEELLAHTDEVTDGALTIRVLDLPTLIAIKAGTGRARDKLVLPILLALLEERESGH